MRTRLLFTSSFLVTLAVAPAAHAMGALVTDPPGASSAVSLRVAVAGASGRTVRWASMEVRGTATSFAWIIAARPGAILDLSSDAWLEGLEASTAPRVIPPDVSPPCGIAGGDEVEGDFTHTATASPEAVAMAGDRASLDAILAAWGLAVPGDVSSALDATLASGEALVVLRYANAPTSPSGSVVTRAVRVVDDAPETIPLSLVGAGASPIAVTAYTIAAGDASFGSAATVSMDPAAVLWQSDGTSTYSAARATLLADNPGGWLFETGGHDLVFDTTSVPGGDSVPALTSTYLLRAASYGDATDPADACVQSADAWASSSASVAAACPAGLLARVGQPACQEVVGAGQIDPAALRCGGIADDLALALSGLAPDTTWITRVRSSIAPESFGGTATMTTTDAAAAYGPVVTASGYAEPCEATSSSSGSGSSGGDVGSNGGGGTGSSSPGGGGSSGGNGRGESSGTAVAVATGVVDVANAATDSSEGCGGDSSGDSCGGDTSSSDEESSGGGCGGDSTGSSSDGGGCSGSDTGSGSDCNVGPRHPSYTSRIGLLLAVIAAVARRRRRPRSSRLP